jgi:hypothetical protein
MHLVIYALLLLVAQQINACTYANQQYDCGARNSQGQYCNWMVTGTNCGYSGGSNCCDWIWCSKIVDCGCHEYISMCQSNEVIDTNQSYT